MYAVSKVIVLLSVALSVFAMPSHFSRPHHGRHGLAARVAVPEPVAEPVAVVEQRDILPPLRRRKRTLNGRCADPSASSSTSVSSSTSTPSSASTPSSTSTPSSKRPATTPVVEYQPASSSSSSSSTAPPQSTSGASGSSSSSSGILSETFKGDGTFYATGLGACGITNTDSDMIAAASELLFDTFPGYDGVNPNNNPICGKTVSVTYEGKQISVTLTDRCTGCAYGALDFSPTAFDKLSDPSVGRIHDIEWHFT
jgi:hypothetical protein